MSDGQRPRSLFDPRIPVRVRRGVCQGGALTRAPIIQWYLEELNLPYDYVEIDLKAGEHRQPEFLAINPFGKLPALVDGDLKLFESGAILLYLADKYDASSAAVEQRALISQWTLFANATLATGLFIEANREKEEPKLLPPLQEILSRQEFLVGDRFTVADVAVGAYLAYIPLFTGMNYAAYPAIESYLNRLNQRPACQNTMGKRLNR